MENDYFFISFQTIAVFLLLRQGLFFPLPENSCLSVLHKQHLLFISHQTTAVLYIFSLYPVSKAIFLFPSKLSLFLYFSPGNGSFIFLPRQRLFYISAQTATVSNLFFDNDWFIFLKKQNLLLYFFLDNSYLLLHPKQQVLSLLSLNNVWCFISQKRQLVLFLCRKGLFPISS